MSSDFSKALLIVCISFANTIALQAQDTRPITIKVVDERGQPLTKTSVQLIDNSGSRFIQSVTDSKGIATFHIDPRISYTGGQIIISKNKSDNVVIPVNINYRTKQLNVEYPDNNAIMDNDLNIPPTVMAIPTDNVTQTTNRAIANMPHLPAADVKWGPYQCGCDDNPLSHVPFYTPLSVEDEASLATAIGNSCIGAAAEAVNALAEATESLISIGIRIKAVCSMQSQSPIQTIKDGLNPITETEMQKANKAIGESYEKASALYSKIEKFAEGPGMYTIKCIFEGSKKFAIPGPLLSLKKANDSYNTGKKKFNDKLSAIKSRMASGKPVSKADLDLFGNWADVTDNFGETITGISSFLSFIKDPAAYLPFQTQANNAITTAQRMMKPLLTNCEARDCDLVLKEGLLAGMTALTASRKSIAQNLKGQSFMRDRINSIVAKNYKQEARGWEYKDPKDIFFLNDDIKNEYRKFIDFGLAAKRAERDTATLTPTVIKLGSLCAQLKSTTEILNQRVAKYDALYDEAVKAANDCDFGKAESLKMQMQQIENSSCNDFFPKPYGYSKSQELNGKIQTAKDSKKCKKDEDTDWTGTWTGTSAWGVVTISISGSGNGISAATVHKKNNGFTDNGNWSGCKLEGSSLTCKWTEQYEDADKKASRSGTLLVIKSGDTISGTSTEDTPNFSWKNGVSPYSSSIAKGAQWSINVRKK